MSINSRLMDEYNKLADELLLNDHVSKSELRAWCEQEENHHKYYDDYYQRDVEVVYLKDILDRFCAGEK